MWARSRGSTRVAPGGSLEEARSLQTIIVVIVTVITIVIVIVIYGSGPFVTATRI